MKTGDLVKHIDDILSPSSSEPIGIILRVEYFDTRTGLYGSYMPRGEYATVAFAGFQINEEWLTRDLRLVSLA